MKKRFPPRIRALLVLATFAATALPPLAPAAESLSVLLQKAIYAEETEGNLDSAIKLYEQIAAEGAPNQSVIAQAQYRLAVCYQKKGNKDQAVSTLNGVLTKFPTESALNQKVRQALTAMGAPPTAPVTLRKLTTLPPGWPIAVSPDGRFVEYQKLNRNGESGDICVYETATGNTRVIVPDDGHGSHIYNTVFSPDGEQLAYVINGLALWVARIDRAEPPRKILERSKSGTAYVRPALIYPSGWSPDSTKVFVSLPDPRTNSVAITAVDARTGATRDIRRLAGQQGGGDISPDGRHLAVRHGKGAAKKLVIVDLETGEEHLVADADGPDIVGWAFGGTKLLYSISPTEKNDQILAATVTDGRPVGQRDVLLSNLGDINDTLTTSDGTIYFSVTVHDASKIRSGEELWAAEGFLTRKVPQRSAPADPVAAIAPGPDNSIGDKTQGFSATLPLSWTVRGTRRTKRITSVDLSTQECPEAQARVSFQTPPNPLSSAEISTFLRRFAENAVVKERNIEADIVDYQNRAESYTARTIAGRPAISWIAEFTRAGDRWTEYLTAVYSDKLGAVARIQVPTSKIDIVRAAYEGLVETIRLP